MWRSDQGLMSLLLGCWFPRRARARQFPSTASFLTPSCSRPALLRPAGTSKGGKLKGEETAVVDQVSLVGSGKDKGFRQANIKLRFNRNPMIGAAPGGLLLP